MLKVYDGSTWQLLTIFENHDNFLQLNLVPTFQQSSQRQETLEFFKPKNHSHLFSLLAVLSHVLLVTPKLQFEKTGEK